MTRRGAVTALALSLLGVGLAASSRAVDEDTCIGCHAREADEEMVAPVEEWRESVHAEAAVSCDACHGGDPRLTDPDESMSEAAGFLDNPSWTEMADYCGLCHEGVALTWKAGVFGRAMEEGVLVPTCATCHMSDGHRILRAVPEEIVTSEACPDCPSVENPQACIATLTAVREQERVLAASMDRVESYGTELADLRESQRKVRESFMSTVHEFDAGGIDAAGALALTLYDGLGEQVTRLESEALRRRRLGGALLGSLALLFVALLGSLRSSRPPREP